MTEEDLPVSYYHHYLMSEMQRRGEYSVPAYISLLTMLFVETVCTVCASRKMPKGEIKYNLDRSVNIIFDDCYDIAREKISIAKEMEMTDG